VPLRPGTKECCDDDWLERAYSVEEIHPGDGIGLLSTNGRVIIDVDSAEAVSTVWTFLPSTPTGGAERAGRAE
jgi:hypothetical protein